MKEADDKPNKYSLSGPKLETCIKTIKPKRRSLIERELETNLTDRVTSPITSGEAGITASRYGRTRKPKQELELSLTEKILKSPAADKTTNENVFMDTIVIKDKVVKTEPTTEGNFVKQNINSLSDNNLSEHKIYVRKDLIQKSDIKGSSGTSTSSNNSHKSRKNSHLHNILERSSEKYDIDTSIDYYKHDATPEKLKNAPPSVVKSLDFDSGKRKKEENKKVLSKSELFELETKCEYQVGDLAWARVGAYPFWPCIVTKDPYCSSGSFVKTKLFGRVERNVIHVTFFGDNGRRGWIVDNMLRKYSGLKEFETTRENFTPQDKKKDPRLYAAFIISDKQTAKWKVSVEEAEILLREPKRLRIDVLNDMLNKTREKVKGITKSTEKISRTDSDVSLSESLYDTLFSEDDCKDEEKIKSKTKKSLDVSEVVTACIDNIAAKSGLPKIHKQSHMDRWLLKAKSKTPEKPTVKKTRDHKLKNKVTPLKDNNTCGPRKGIAESSKKQKIQKVNKTSSTNSDSDNHIDLTSSSTDEEMCKYRGSTSDIGCGSKLLSVSDHQSKDNTESCNTRKETSAVRSDAESINSGENSIINKKEHTTSKIDGQKAALNTHNNCNSMFQGGVDVSSDDKINLPVVSNPEKNKLTDEINETIESTRSIEESTKLDNEHNISNKKLVIDSKTSDKPLRSNDDTNKDTNNKKSAKSLRPYRNKVNLSLNKTKPIPFLPNNEKDLRTKIQAVNQSNGDITLDDEERSQVDLADKKLTNHEATKLPKSETLKCTKNISKCEKIHIETSEDKDSGADVYLEEEILRASKIKLQTNENQASVVNVIDDVVHREIQMNGHADELLMDSSKEDNASKMITQRANEVSNRVHNNAKEHDETDRGIVKTSFEINTVISEDSCLNQFSVIKSNELNGINKTGVPLEELQQEEVVNGSDVEKKSQKVDDATIGEIQINFQKHMDDNICKDTVDESQNAESQNANANTDDKNGSTEVVTVNYIGTLVEPEAKPVVLLDRNIINKHYKGALDSVKSECSEDSGSDDKPLSVVKCDKDDGNQETDKEINTDTKDKSKRKPKTNNTIEDCMENPEFVKYLELRQDTITDENPQLTEDEITEYLYKTWVYEQGIKPANQCEIDQTSLVKGLDEPVTQPKKVGRKKKEKPDLEKDYVTNKKAADDNVTKEKPKRKVVKTSYNEEDTDFEDELKYFEIFRNKKSPASKSGSLRADGVKYESDIDPKSNEEEASDDLLEYDEVEGYFEEMVKPKPNVFKGLARERVCEVCERAGNLIKCKGPCAGMFHVECAAKKEVEILSPVTKGRKKKKPRGRKQKSLDDSESQSDEKLEDEENRVFDADEFEKEIAAKLQELLSEVVDLNDYHSSDEEIDWSTEPGRCDIVDIKLRPRQTDNSQYANFRCGHCADSDTPLCFVCKRNYSPKSKTDARQKCQVAHCNKYFHVECLDMWPQTQFSSGDAKSPGLTCPRHVCHTCVCDDPRGCKTRFSGDKLARCVRCPATYHSFTKCLPAGSTILSGSHIICPRHYENRPGKVPCHVNTGWCFICALGGTLICCEYCPTSFHAECLNISPPEGNYMCEDCETGRLPLYGEMVWVKLGHYRWWPGLILHPCEIPENIMAVKHSMGEFVVRFFGQYDHYWVNRGRVFPFQEGDSGKISSQKSKIDEAFTTAMEHAQRACEVMKTAPPNSEEDGDIAQSLLPPRYVKLRANKPRPPLARRDPDDASLSTCDCDPLAEAPCAPHTQCLNRMLLTECGPSCRAGDRCLNRAFERRQYPALAAHRAPRRGWGLRTLQDIRQGSFVIEYVGELIDEAEFRRRMRRKHELRDENYYFLTLDKDRMIDAGPKGNLARFMNHSCEPNCETQKWTVLGDVRVGLFALRDIPANSEVTFNYNLECAGIEKKPCLCGARLCSGYIGAKPKQEEVVKKQKPLKARKRGRPTKESKESKEKESPAAAKPRVKPKPTRARPKELTEIEKDLLIIKSATNGLSSDSECSVRSSVDENGKAVKRKRASSVELSGASGPKRLKADEL